MDGCLLKKLYRDRNRLCLRTWKSKYCEKEKREREKKRYYGNSKKKKEKDESDCRIKIRYDKTLIAERIIRDTMCNLGFQPGKRASSDLNNVTFDEVGRRGKKGEGILSKL